MTEKSIGIFCAEYNLGSSVQEAEYESTASQHPVHFTDFM
jgi:hypothetical protein